MKVKLKAGDYVFASKWSDEDPNDPWYVGTLSCIKNERFYLNETGRIGFRNCRRITREQGENILKERLGHE